MSPKVIVPIAYVGPSWRGDAIRRPGSLGNREREGREVNFLEQAVNPN